MHIMINIIFFKSYIEPDQIESFVKAGQWVIGIGYIMFLLFYVFKILQMKKISPSSHSSYFSLIFLM